MNRQTLLNNTVKKLKQLPNKKLLEVQDFVDFLLSQIDDHLLVEGISKLTSDSKSFDYLKEEEDLYTVNDLKEKYQ